VLRTRVWTAAAILPPLLAIIGFSSPAFFTCFTAALCGWGLYEIASVRRANAADFGLIFGIGGGLAVLLLHGFAFAGCVVSLVVVAMTAITARVGVFGPDCGITDSAMSLLGALYVGALFPYFALVRNKPHGTATTVLMLILVVASDTGAYFAGRSLGRRKLVERVSPNKTAEGALGGLIATVIAGWIAGPFLAPRLSFAQLFVYSSLTGILAQLGDLAGSAYKRVSGVKDFGWILPGHGGLLDRTCSLVFAVAFTYYFIQ
jgi:phosphatidate cytidylyltransferase